MSGSQVRGPWALRSAMFAGLAFMLWGETTHPGAAGLHGTGLATSIALAVASMCWIAWTLAGPLGDAPLVLTFTALTGLAGSALLVVHPAVAVYWFTFWACGTAGVYFPRWAGVGLTAACCAILVAGYLAGRGDALASFAAVGFVAHVLGRNRRLYVGQARQALLTAQERERAATLAERGRIARELHDVLAHSLTGISLQVQAASAALEIAADPDRALTHLDRAGDLVRGAQEEAVAAVSTLHEGDVAVLAMVEGLVDACHGDGTPAVLTVTGPPRALPAAPGLAVYRLVQEALTNAAKHAPGTPVAVDLDFTGGTLEVSVVNVARDGTGDPVSGGHGLHGMRDRVAAVGGALSYGPTGTGWRVQAQVRG